MMKKKDYLKKEDSKWKKERRDNLNDDEKEQLRKYEKKRKRVMRVTLRLVKKKKLEKIIKKERWISVSRLFMKEAVSLIMSKCIVRLTPAYSQHQLSE